MINFTISTIIIQAQAIRVKITEGKDRGNFASVFAEAKVKTIIVNTF
jgi:hypothetical protein